MWRRRRSRTDATGSDSGSGWASTTGGGGGSASTYSDLDSWEEVQTSAREPDLQWGAPPSPLPPRPDHPPTHTQTLEEEQRRRGVGHRQHTAQRKQSVQQQQHRAGGGVMGHGSVLAEPPHAAVRASPSAPPMEEPPLQQRRRGRHGRQSNEAMVQSPTIEPQPWVRLGGCQRRVELRLCRTGTSHFESVFWSPTLCAAVSC